MATVAEVIDTAEKRMQAVGVDGPRRDARILLGFVMGWPAQMVSMRTEILLMPHQEDLFFLLVDKRVQRQPISQILGRRGFWTLDLQVTQDTLDPRPDSETVVEAVLEHNPNRSRFLNILDLGTGTGCLLLALLSEFPAAFGVGVDISPEALLVARSNAALCSLTERVRFVQSRWGDALQGIEFDIIVSNPPYIPDAEIDLLEPEVAKWEPRLALAGGPDGLDCYRTIIPLAATLLKSGGMIVFEVGAGQSQDVANMGMAQGLGLLKIHKDLSGIERCVCLTKA
jgi:release factor glutamine methyltransferase